MRHGFCLRLQGPAGVGKTRVAQRIATQAIASGRFIDGVVFCELAACTNVSDALYALAKSLGVSLSGQHTVVDAVQTLGEAVSRRGRTLCVVDNVEHLARCSTLSTTHSVRPRRETASPKV